MPVTMDLIFSGQSIKNLAQTNPYGVKVTLAVDASGKQLVIARAFDKNAQPLGNQDERGCPSPCRPGGTYVDCINQLVDTWENLTGEGWL